MIRQQVDTFYRFDFQRKKEKRQKNSETEETKNSDNAGRPKLCVPKKQFKEEGKGGSLGVSVAPDGTVAEDLKAESCDVAERPAREKAIPRALKANTEEDVQEMFNSGYYRFPERPFWDGVRFEDVDRGTRALWKNGPTGKNGGESSKVEYFHGEVQGWKTNDLVIVRSVAHEGHREVHWSYLVGDPKQEYCIAAGGRCYREADVWATQLQKVQCPQCGRQFNTQWDYESHYEGVHRS